jgi:diguanylate cyclase (GGDEF)-like protein
MNFKGRAISLHASIGISVYPHDGHDAEVLIERADGAMYQVKTNGKNNYSLYSSELN